MKKAAFVTVLSLIAVVKVDAQSIDDLEKAQIPRHVPTYDEIVFEKVLVEAPVDSCSTETPKERYERAMRELGNWNINLFPIAVLEPGPRDWFEEEEWFGLEGISLRTMVPLGYRPLRQEELIGYRFRKHGKWHVSLEGFESRTDLRYFEVTEEDYKTGKRVRIRNERALGGVFLFTYSW